MDVSSFSYALTLVCYSAVCSHFLTASCILLVTNFHRDSEKSRSPSPFDITDGAGDMSPYVSPLVTIPTHNDSSRMAANFCTRQEQPHAISPSIDSVQSRHSSQTPSHLASSASSNPPATMRMVPGYEGDYSFSRSPSPVAPPYSPLTPVDK